MTAQGVRGWRKLFSERITRIAERYPPKIEVDLDALGDMANTLVDGGIILTKVLKEKDALPKQIMLYREFVRSVVLGA